MSTHLTALGLTLLHAGWQVLVVAALYRLCELCLTQLSIGSRYRLGLGAMVLSLAMAMATFIYEEARLSTAAAALTPAAPLSMAPQLGISVWLPWIDAAWLTGVGVLSLRLAGGLWFINALHRAALPAPAELIRRFDVMAQGLGLGGRVTLRLHPRISSPFVTGIVRSVVYLPLSIVSALSPEQLDSVLSHELEHVLRRDYFWNLVQSTIEILFYFHPAVWWLGSRLREQRELICDDAALMACRDPIVYATALLRLEEERREVIAHPRLAMALNGHRQNLFWRIARILDEDAEGAAKSSRLLRAAGAALSLPLAAALLAAFAPPVAQSAAKVAGKLITPQATSAVQSDSEKTEDLKASDDKILTEDGPTAKPSRDIVIREHKDKASGKTFYTIGDADIDLRTGNPEDIAAIARNAAIQARRAMVIVRDQHIDADQIAREARLAAEQARQDAIRAGRDAADIDPDAIAAEARNAALKAQADLNLVISDHIKSDAVMARANAEVAHDQADIERAKALSAKMKAGKMKAGEGKAKVYFWLDAKARDEVPAPVVPPAPPSPAALPSPAMPPSPAAPMPPAAPPTPAGYIIHFTPQKPVKMVMPATSAAPVSTPNVDVKVLAAMPEARAQAIPATHVAIKGVYAISARSYATAKDAYSISVNASQSSAPSSDQ